MKYTRTDYSTQVYHLTCKTADAVGVPITDRVETMNLFIYQKRPDISTLLSDFAIAKMQWLQFHENNDAINPTNQPLEAGEAQKLLALSQNWESALQSLLDAINQLKAEKIA